MSPQTITSFLSILALPSFAPETNGKTSNVLNRFQGIVREKNESGEKFVSYKVSDRDDPTTVYKILCYKKDYLCVDNMSFLEMHDDVEEEDFVSIQGFAAKSKKGNPYIRATAVLVNEYGNNDYESTDHDDSDDEHFMDLPMSDDDSDYTPSESSESSLGEESETESVNETYQPTDQELDGTHVSIEEIPLTIYKDFVKYQGLYFSLDSVRTNTPFKIVLGTKVAEFHITKMDSNFMGVFVSENPLEPDHQYGYDMILSGKFRNLLKTLM